jgi:hypothetical protein
MRREDSRSYEDIFRVFAEPLIEVHLLGAAQASGQVTNTVRKKCASDAAAIVDDVCQSARKEAKRLGFSDPSAPSAPLSRPRSARGLNQRQVARAARLYSLAKVAQMDTGGCESDVQDAVVELAVSNARRDLELQGFGGTELHGLQQIIDVVKNGN